MLQNKDLATRLERLEAENRYLKKLLDEAGIGYDLLRREVMFDPDQGSRIRPVEITKDLANRFFSYFWGRMDVYCLRFVSRKTGKTGYSLECARKWLKGVCFLKEGVHCKDCAYFQPRKMSLHTIQRHLIGSEPDASDVIGVYPLFPDGTCRFLVFDFDNHKDGADGLDGANVDDTWMDEVDALREICRINGVPALVERSRSGRGAHVWLFFDGPIEASLARRFGFYLLDKGAESVNLKSFSYYDRMIPAQDRLRAGGFGNLIALPLQGQALRNGNSAFIDENWNAYPDQWGALLSARKISRQTMEDILRDYPEYDNKRLANPDEQYGIDPDMPWEIKNAFIPGNADGPIKLVLYDNIYIEKRNLAIPLQNGLRRLGALPNPSFFKNDAMGVSNYDNSRIINLGYDEGNYIVLPRGVLDKVLEKLKAGNLKWEITDKRTAGNPIRAGFTGQLRVNQRIAADQLLQYDNGILSAATAFGKTVVCTELITELKTSTLIILESSELIGQWQNALDKYITIDEDLPEYQTKTGRTKKRKSPVGLIQGAKDTSTGIVDIAMARSLCRKGEFHHRLKEYGLILVDECHHSASESLQAVLRHATARYIFGVTATPFRADGLGRINFMLLGDIRFTYSSKERAEEQGIDHVVIPRFTRIVCPHGREQMHITDAYKLICESEIRNEQIAGDIRRSVEKKRTPIVLTKTVEQAKTIYEKVKGDADHVFLLLGSMAKKERSELREQMSQVVPEETLILIGTGQLIGEGFDFPRLDTLIMAAPIAAKGLVEQYAGRLNRDYEGKNDVVIIDYIDTHIPKFDAMYIKRLRAYKRIGYRVAADAAPGTQDSNSIFDFETYIPVYEQDLRNAGKEIVLSSPTLGAKKVYRLIRLLQERQEAGVKVTVVTWDPSVYKYGSDEHRIELMEELRNAGIHIELTTENCERYAVIDNEIVWYGSMNLLSKDDVDDNIMRIVSKEIAAELLEITFHKDSEIRQYNLPM